MQPSQQNCAALKNRSTTLGKKLGGILLQTNNLPPAEHNGQPPTSGQQTQQLFLNQSVQGITQQMLGTSKFGGGDAQNALEPNEQPAYLFRLSQKLVAQVLSDYNASILYSLKIRPKKASGLWPGCAQTKQSSYQSPGFFEVSNCPADIKELIQVQKQYPQIKKQFYGRLLSQFRLFTQMNSSFEDAQLIERQNRIPADAQEFYFQFYVNFYLQHHQSKSDLLARVLQGVGLAAKAHVIGCPSPLSLPSHAHAHTHTCIHTCIHTHTHPHAPTGTHTHASAYILTHTHTHTRTCTYSHTAHPLPGVSTLSLSVQPAHPNFCCLSLSGESVSRPHKLSAVSLAAGACEQYRRAG